jgi:hypothetical protein
VAGGGREPDHIAEAFASLVSLVELWAPDHGQTAALDDPTLDDVRADPDAAARAIDAATDTWEVAP